MKSNIADAQYAFVNRNADAINGNLKLFWIAMGGKEDIAYRDRQSMPSKFDEMNIKYIYYESPGGHTWPVWRDDVYRMTPLLFK